jgi:type III secretory pathway component EscS
MREVIIYPSVKGLLIWKLLIVIAFVGVMISLISSGVLMRVRDKTALSYDGHMLAVSTGLYLAALIASYTLLKFAQQFEAISWALRTFGIVFACLLPARSFITGRETALRVAEDKEFFYTIADSLEVPTKQIYKYLGKAGDYHFMLTQVTNKQVVVPCAKTEVLLIEKFSLDDSVSIRRYQFHQKELAALASK